MSVSRQKKSLGLIGTGSKHTLANSNDITWERCLTFIISYLTCIFGLHITTSLRLLSTPIGLKKI